MAAALAAAVSLSVLAFLFKDRVYEVLRERVDLQLIERADTAPILAAVGDRLSVSELGATVEGARILYDHGPDGPFVVDVGSLPATDLPMVVGPGWQTTRTDGQDWRLYTVEVLDVPQIGDRTLVQLVAPLGDVDHLAAAQQRESVVLAVAAVLASAAVGYVLGALATRPLGRLRRHAMTVGSQRADTDDMSWRIPERYGATEVNDVAAVLNDGLAKLADASRQREVTLETARSFAATAAHELRTPLTGAITNLDLVVHPDASPSEQVVGIADARQQLRRISETLTALRQLADADLSDPAWFVPYDLSDQIAVIVESEARRNPDARFELEAPADACNVVAWPDGVQLAVSNLVRNALLHGRPTNGPQYIRLTIDCAVALVSIVVDDNGPGVETDDRERLKQRFQRGADSSGSGLGLALASQLAHIHGGELTIGDSPLGGARVSLTIRSRSGRPAVGARSG